MAGERTTRRQKDISRLLRDRRRSQTERAGTVRRDSRTDPVFRRMAMKKDKRLNALEVALQNELRERKFYLTNAERTANPAGRTMFRQIADDELEHYERLKQLHGSWVKAEKWPDSIPLRVKNTAVQDVLKDMLQKTEKMPKGDADDLKAVREAIDFEAKGEKYYAELRDAVSDAREKEFFDLLSRMEREHHLALVDVEELMTDPVSWYRRTEHHGIDGA